MQLTRCQDQKRQTLDEFYTEAAHGTEPVTREGGQTMLDLLVRLGKLPDERRICGLTSHYRLCFLASFQRNFQALLGTESAFEPYFLRVLRTPLIFLRVPTVTVAWGGRFRQAQLQGVQQLLLEGAGLGHLSEHDFAAVAMNQFLDAQLL